MPRVRGSRGLVPIIPVVIRHVQGTRAFSVNAVCYRDKDAVRGGGGGGGGTERVELQGQTSTTIQEDERQSFEKVCVCVCVCVCTHVCIRREHTKTKFP